MHSAYEHLKVLHVVGPFETDGGCFSTRGEVRTDNADNNVIEAYATDGQEDVIVRRGFRGDKFVATYKFKWNGSTFPGFLVRWLSPGDYLAVAVVTSGFSGTRAELFRRQNDGTLTSLASSGTTLSLTSSTWYEGKVVIDNDPNNANLQQLRFWVDTDNDGDYSDETTLLTTTAVDDDWPLTPRRRRSRRAAARPANFVRSAVSRAGRPATWGCTATPAGRRPSSTTT